MIGSQNEITSLMQHLIDQVATKAAGRLISTVQQHLETQIATALKGQRLLVDSDELAKQLMVSKSTIVKLRKQGMPVIRIGDSVRFDPKAVMQFLSINYKSNYHGNNPKAE